MDYTGDLKTLFLKSEGEPLFDFNAKAYEISEDAVQLQPTHFSSPDTNLRGVMGDRLIMDVWPSLPEGSTAEASEEDTRLVQYDPVADTEVDLTQWSYNSNYMNTTCVIDDRYFVLQCHDVAEKGHLYVYDSETGEVKGDIYDPHNLVGAVTPVGNEGVAYFYYEAETQDWVVRYYHLETHESKEIFRHTNFNENDTTSPMELIYDGKNLALVIQYLSGETGYTVLQWMTTQGEVLEAERIPLEEFCDNTQYEILSARVEGNFYYFAASTLPYGTKQYTMVLERKGDYLTPVSMATFSPQWPEVLCSNGMLGMVGSDFQRDADTIRTLLFADFENRRWLKYHIPDATLTSDTLSNTYYVTSKGIGMLEYDANTNQYTRRCFMPYEDFTEVPYADDSQ